MKRLFILLTILTMFGIANVSSAFPPMPKYVNAPIHLSTDPVVTVTDKKGSYYNYDDDAIQFNLPAAAAGSNFCFHTYTFAKIVTIDPNGTNVIVLDGAAESAGEAIVSSGAAGEYICLQAINSTTWVNWDKGGTWDGAVD